ncbi:MAG: glycoside hydrolase family 75 protein [Akkermansiaceae bacterium]
MPSHPENHKKHDPHEIEGVKSRHARAHSFPWLRVSFFVLCVGMVALLFSPIPEKVYRKISQLKRAGAEKRESPSEQPKPAKVPKPSEPVIRAPQDHTVASGGDVRMMSRGLQLQTKITLEKGRAASLERSTEDSYSAHYELKVKLPAAVTTLPELEKNTPGLGAVLPGLEAMMPTAKVSGFFYQLYENKTKRLRSNATRLNELMTRHNFYDCETILNLTHPETGKRVLLMQAEMDVVSDGSDGDRLPVMPDKIVNSTNYQPLTSYGWKKTGKTPNPLIAGWKNRIRKAEEEIAAGAATEDRKAWLRSRMEKIRREIRDMEARSFLIADYDPFIVMPINMLTSRGDAHAARVGDYAIVIHDGKIYPTIVGDAGPSFKVGEASLRFCKQINSNAGIYSRPVSDLTVTYIVFPGSRDSFREPDYEFWQQRCSELLNEVGGLGVDSAFYEWEYTLSPSGK